MNRRPFRIVFMGTPAFAVPSLAALLGHGEEVAAVVTQPDRPKGRSGKPVPPPVKELALAHAIPVLQPEKIRTTGFRETIAALRPDLLVVTAYGRILPGELLRTPPLGTINVHGSLLPRYRGAAPVQWAIIRGETETGITIMQMDEGMDTGDILLPGSLPIAADDTAATLAVKMADLGGRLLVEALDLLREGRLRPTKQDDSRATLAPPLNKEQGRIDWRRPATEIGCLIRGTDPWPAAFTHLAGERLRLFAPRPIGAPADGAPGTILAADSAGLLVACGTERLLITEIQRDGGRRMAVAAFLQGHPLTPGARLG
ncbi:MAG: methionyl-tRNA formyltransferase [Thermodesulfobacteriota bacterium]